MHKLKQMVFSTLSESFVEPVFSYLFSFSYMRILLTIDLFNLKQIDCLSNCYYATFKYLWYFYKFQIELWVQSNELSSARLRAPDASLQIIQTTTLGCGEVIPTTAEWNSLHCPTELPSLSRVIKYNKVEWDSFRVWSLWQWIFGQLMSRFATFALSARRRSKDNCVSVLSIA